MPPTGVVFCQGRRAARAVGVCRQEGRRFDDGRSWWEFEAFRTRRRAMLSASQPNGHRRPYSAVPPRHVSASRA